MTIEAFLTAEAHAGVPTALTSPGSCIPGPAGRNLNEQLAWPAQDMTEQSITKLLSNHADYGVRAASRSPVAPSMRSRRRSAWPLWRAYSSIMWVRM